MPENRELRRRVGKNMKRLRNQAGKTQDQLAEQLDITPRHLIDLENGRFDIGVDLMGNAALALEVDPAEFFRIVADRKDNRTYKLTPHEFERVEDALRVVERVKRRRAEDDST